ncbi:MAG: hypothetical protein ABI862_20600 [Ilumatobacteraceae bacterium]
MIRKNRHAVRFLTIVLAAAVATNCAEQAAAPSGSTATIATNPSQSTSTIPDALGPVAPAPTVAGQTTVASTTPPPLDPSVETAVKQGVQDFFTAYMACGQAPAACHAADFHSTRGTAVGQGTVYFQGLAARGEYFATDLRGSYIVTQSVALDDPTSAITFSCWYDASTLLGPVDATGQPTVLNDKIISVREKQALYFDGTSWKVGEAATVQDLGDGNQCPPPDLAS